jgi:signal transduction histidine kinase
VTTFGDPCERGSRELEIAQLAHDLRNQLTMVMACADEISLTAGFHNEQEIAQLLRCADRAAVLTKELFDAAKPRPSAPARVDLSEVVAHAIAGFSCFYRQGIRLQLRLWPRPVPVMAERIELDRIILNLALNAREAMPDGGDLTITTCIEAGAALVRIRDTGPGISARVQTRMSEPFYTAKDRGTGLGLSSVASAVQRLEGSIDVASEGGRGTEVSVRLPLFREPTRTPSPTRASTPARI